MMDGQTQREEWARIEQEHAHLFTLFDKLEGMVDRKAAITALDELEKWLLHHFAREERPGGLLHSLPGDVTLVRAVVAEHGVILEVLRESRAMLEAADGPALEPELIRQVTAEVGANLRSHEEHERALLHHHLGDGEGTP